MSGDRPAPPKARRAAARRRAAAKELTMRRLLALATVAALALSGCGLGGNDPQATPQGRIGGEVKGTITFQTWNLREKFADYFNGLVADFEKEYPGTTVKWVDQPADGYADKLQADAAADALPDVLNTTPDLGYPLAKAGLLLDLDAVVPEAKTNYLPNAWTGFAAPDGKSGAYAFPWYLNTGPVFYNKELFRKAGLDPNKPPTTYTELRDQALTMAKAKIAMLGQTPGIEDFGLFGVPLMNADGTEFTFNDPKGVELVEMYKQLYDAKALLPEALTQTYTGSGAKFMAQQVALSPGSGYDLENFRTNAPGLYKNVGITKTITNTGSANMYLQGLSVAAHGKNRATALAFARFATNAKNQLAFAKIVTIFPSSQGTLEDEYFTDDGGTDVGRVRVAAAAQLKTAVNYTPTQLSEQMKDTLRQELANAMLGKKPAKKALDDAVAKCNSLL
jgi:multiple sugar transport system substrate-binding protein